MKRILFILLLSVSTLQAQQVGMYSHSFYKPMILNPAFTGMSDAANVLVLSRSQWSDFSGTPQLNMASLDGNIIDKKAGLGILLVSDKKGITSRTGGSVFYSYRLNINDDMHLRFGLSLGVVDHRVDYSKAIVETANDATLFPDSQSKIVFDGNAGLALVWKKLEFGFAVPQIIGNKVKYVDTSNVRGTYTQSRHFMGSLKYGIALSEEKEMYLVPEAVVRFVPNTPFQYDAGLNFEWHDKFWIGATYKSAYAIGANVGFCVHKKLTVGYSYDIITGNIGKYSGMAHELMINFKFGKKKEEAAEMPKEDKGVDKAAYERRMDSLETEVQISQAKIRQLSDKLDQQAKEQQTLKQAQQDNPQVQNNQQSQNPQVQTNPVNPPQNAGNQPPPQNTGGNNNTQVQGSQNAEIADASTNKRFENGVLIVSAKKQEFKNDNGQQPPKGYYVVIGTYFYRDLAIAETQRFVARGYKTSDWVYSGPKNYNYIFMFKLKTKEEAMEKLKVAKDAGVKDAWIQEITD
jgi:type IX secretion system PorP/SprF family membrane protein